LRDGIGHRLGQRLGGLVDAIGLRALGFILTFAIVGSGRVTRLRARAGGFVGLFARLRAEMEVEVPPLSASLGSRGTRPKVSRMTEAKALNFGMSVLADISMMTKKAMRSTAMSAKVRIQGGGQWPPPPWSPCPPSPWSSWSSWTCSAPP
jgi:hypothetical protein